MFWKTVGVFCLILIDSGQFSFLHNSTTTNQDEDVHNRRRFNTKRMNDSIFDGTSANSGNKAFLKTRLLENLNNFYPSLSTNEQLEILSGTPQQNDENHDFANSVTESSMNQNFPTLLPNDPMMNDPMQELEMATAPSTKIRAEGRIKPNLDSIDSIRDWRKRLYRAFKNRSKINRIIKTPTEEVVEMNDVSPIVMDKNRQILLSRKEPNWQSVFGGGKNIQTYGRDANGKLIPLFGLDANLLQQQLQQQQQSSQTPIEPYPPREIRFAYRTSNGQSVVYIPSSSSSSGRSLPDIVPVPVSSYLVTATPPPFPSAPPIQLHLLPAVTQPTPQQVQLIFPPAPSRSTNNEYFGQSFQTTPLPYSTFAPKDYDDRDLPNNNCGGCTGNGGNMQNNGIGTDGPMDEKCNSLRLRNIIMNNIVQGDAESSKRAVQSAAEAEIGNFFDAICGTGVFSYIAHTDEFCLASSGGVNCYVFAPVCGTSAGGQNNIKRKSHLNKN